MKGVELVEVRLSYSPLPCFESPFCRSRVVYKSGFGAHMCFNSRPFGLYGQSVTKSAWTILELVEQTTPTMPNVETATADVDISTK